MAEDMLAFPMERFDPTGHWMRSLNFDPGLGEVLLGDRRFDVVVIGAGFTGLSAAIALAERGLKVAVVEKLGIGGGASGWNCGQVGLDLGLNAPTTLMMFGAERTQAYANLLRRAIGNVQVMAERSGRAIDYRENGNILAGIDPLQRRFAEQTADLFARFGLPVTFLERDGLDHLGIPDFVSFGVHEGIGGTLHPGKYVHALAHLALSLGVRIFEHSPVCGFEKGAVVRVRTAHGSLVAPMAVLATNAFSAELGELRREYLPFSVSVMVTEPLTAEQRGRLDWRGEHGIHTAHKVIENIRFTPDGRLLIGTKCVQHGYSTSHPEPQNPKSFAALMRVLRDRFPGLNDLKPASGWTGRVALSADTLPFYRFVDGHANIVTAGGYGGHGIAMASYAGQILARMLTQDPYEDAEPFVHRKRIPLPPEPFKWVLSRAMKIGMAFADNSADKRFRSAAAARHKTHLQPGNH